MVDAFLGSRAYVACAGSSLFWSFAVGLLPGAGTRPGGRPTFLARARKVGKRSTPLLSVSPSLARRGSLRCSGVGRCRVTHCAPAALRSNRRGKSDHEARVSFGTRARPTPCAPRYGQKGVEVPHGPSLRSAWTSRRVAPAPARPSAAMARVVSTPFQAAPGARRWRGGMREVAHTSWSDSLRLFERSAQRAASSAAHPASVSPQVCPHAQRGGRRLRGAFLWVLSCRAARKYLARRGESRLREANPQQKTKKESYQRKTDKPWRQIGEHP